MTLILRDTQTNWRRAHRASVSTACAVPAGLSRDSRWAAPRGTKSCGALVSADTRAAILFGNQTFWSPLG